MLGDNREKVMNAWTLASLAMLMTSLGNGEASLPASISLRIGVTTQVHIEWRSFQAQEDMSFLPRPRITSWLWFPCWLFSLSLLTNHCRSSTATRLSISWSAALLDKEHMSIPASINNIDSITQLIFVCTFPCTVDSARCREINRLYKQ
jgi:hypothetical protein